MKKLIILLFIVAGCSVTEQHVSDVLSLAGEWEFRIDSLDQGLSRKWYNEKFDESVKLPGSMAENGKGNEVTVFTDWTGDIIDRSYFTDARYEKYRQPGNIKIPFWLKPVKYYKGAAWYQKEFDLPVTREDRRVILFLERCHWESKVFVNGREAGTQNSLAAPHEYDITDLVSTGKNKISIRIDNRIIIPVGVNSHSISDHTQSNWNGITGDIYLQFRPQVYIDNVRIVPDIKENNAKVIVSIRNPRKTGFKGTLRLRAESFNTRQKQILPEKSEKISTDTDEQQVIISYKIRKPLLWSEFSPSMYRMSVTLTESDKGLSDNCLVDFGMREFTTSGTRFEVNGRPVFLRGTTECCIFPLTGYPPSDEASWEKVLQTCRDYGLNHMRFHSYCPPEAAFRAADKLGIYFHVECSSWANQGSSIGDGGIIDRFIYEEGDRIIKEYGNHPSFCMLAYGNEPAGKNQNAFLGQLINYWKSNDGRRLYTSAAGWPVIPENDYHLIPAPRIQQWGEGLKSIINREAPQTLFDFREIIGKYEVPVVGHEIGQWCVYPDFSEINSYTGVLKPANFEIFRETLEKNNMGDQAEDFLKASGKLQVLCYKADIEAALRTPGYGGFELLQIYDFPGQGTALVGILNPFFGSKGYVSPEEFRMFCNETVPLARLEKMIYKAGEKLTADIEIAHFGEKPLKNARILCRLVSADGKIFGEETMHVDEIEIGNGKTIGTFKTDIPDFARAEQLDFEISIDGTSFRNHWNLWAYPSSVKSDPREVYVTDMIDGKTEDILAGGGSVLLLTYGKVGRTQGAQVAIGFSSIFWNTAWTKNQPPHTLGILCDPGHPLFTGFPTEYHSNWQWWDPVTHSQAMILDAFPAKLKPLIQPIDTWFENRKLALAFEVKAGGGKMLVCSIDLKDIPEERPVSKQLIASILNYMNSDSFNPQTDIELKQVYELINK
ncbi:MAG TPA: glycoside hydrolase family 2 TIM barrel-domain containing protein [Bacteroidales bacterium]|jgi:hypothetical protein|nr:glycoside hydrolase family 2 TIM barrel-domain containing protein [Bacteroidales bacterium]HQH23684.1 glycoside hydrolase family 2 TIM barrel-domain containing protein [Bacteroidales bacterium]HQJ82311.1 glycoside hydrolase family 2 TIM barrel-domain containing protein [Bacteroidales bacterium]